MKYELIQSLLNKATAKLKKRIQIHNTVVLPANNHSTEHRRPASIQHVVSEVVCVSDVNPERKNEKETQADDRCNPVMSAAFSICQKKKLSRKLRGNRHSLQRLT